MRLIVNADDFGYSPGQNYGIIDAFKNGIVRSTTLMTTTPASLHAIELAHAHPELGVGVHLVLDMGKPVSAPDLIPSLVDTNGVFLRPPFESFLTVNIYEVEQEWRAQIALAKKHGIQPTHLDGHHHFHLHPQLVGITCKLAQEYNLPIRSLQPDYDLGPYQDEYKVLATVKKPDCCLTDFYDTNVDEQYFTNFFASYPHLKDSSVEIMCHPAYMDDIIATQSSYNIQRVRELQVLKAESVMAWVNKFNIELTNFNIF